MLPAQVHLTLPVWIHDAFDAARVFASDADKVALAVELSRRNVEARSGGPFGAVLFGPDDRVIAAAVNRVVPLTTSLAHAENMVYMLAQQRLQTPRLNDVLSPITTAADAAKSIAMCPISWSKVNGSASNSPFDAQAPIS